jgi:UDP-N-acetylmuramate--alanine ligase
MITHKSNGHIRRLELYPDKSLPCFSLIYSAEQDFADDFAKSLSQFDELLLLDILPARELPMEGITSWLLGKNHKKIRS